MKPLLPALLLLAVPVSAQIEVNVTVGPDPSPVGSDVAITVSNDMLGFVSITGCPVQIFDTDMNLVADLDGGFGCLGIVDVGPYGWRTFEWDQTDTTGAQVPPGRYVARVGYDFQAPTFHPFVIDAKVERNLVLEGTPTTKDPLNGQHRNFYLASPGDGGLVYYLVTSLSADAGFPTCAGTFPLDPDFLLQLTSIPNKALLGNFGVLSPAGTTTTPRIPIPDDPGLIGLELFSAFFVVDFAASPCVLSGFSPAYSMTIVE